MKRKENQDNLSQLTSVIVEALQEKKGKDIVILDLRQLDSRVVDKFIICHGDSDRQVDALAQAVEENVERNLSERVWHREGYENKEWILLDYVDVVVHIFLEDKRGFFALESLWGDAEIEKVEEAENNLNSENVLRR